MTEQRRRIVCPIWQSPNAFAVLDGEDRYIEFSCKSCRGEKHRISREQLDLLWNDMEKEQSRLTLEQHAS